MSRLALGVIETVNGNEIDGIGVRHRGALHGLAKNCDPAMALIHASEMERLGPGPMTPSWMVPIAAEVGADPAAESIRSELHLPLRWSRWWLSLSRRRSSLPRWP